ncbi:MAG: hypothetical protein E6G92_09540 [Alphaproteobacteria bacterium]|nr:MAG: hypothetical protein E6G92_09540 [Alphaproteobacteria bacterium]
MKVLALASAAVLITLAGCNQRGAGANDSSANAAAGNASGGKDSANGNSAASNEIAGVSGGKDSGGAAPAGTGPVTLDRAFVVGRWSDDGDCSDVIEFTQDGRFITANGAGGLWNLDGDRLTMTGRATATIRLSPIDQNTMTVINADGSLGRSTRC